MAMLNHFSGVRLFVTPWTVAHQAPLSMRFSRQELEWVAISFSRGSSPPRDQICISCIAGGFFTAEPPGKPWNQWTPVIYLQKVGMLFFPSWNVAKVQEQGDLGRGKINPILLQSPPPPWSLIVSCWEPSLLSGWPCVKHISLFSALAKGVLAS